MSEIVGSSTAPGTAGVTGTSSQFNGVLGETMADGHAGVAGICDTSNGNGVYGRSALSDGVVGTTTGPGKAGVAGICDVGAGNGIYGHSAEGNGVAGHSLSAEHAAVAGTNDNPAGVGIYGKGGRLAGFFDGDVEVTGDIRLHNADCAEQFDIAENCGVEAGTVMVLTDDGALRQSVLPYDRRVAGVISGAGTFEPGIVLDSGDSNSARQPVALLGKTFCKVDASFGAIEVGDLLTTSGTPGHAMKASDPSRAFGSVIGKALRSIENGQGLIPILIALQ